MNPYDILGIPRTTDDEAVRKAYLELVRQHSPDRDPDRFQQISRAYEQLKDEDARLRYDLFNRETPGRTPFEVLVRHTKQSGERKPPTFQQMKEFILQCAKTKP